MPPQLWRGVLYDWECEHVLRRGTADVDWYADLAARAGPGAILELACGTGRVAVPLARRSGRPVVGVDIEMEMLLTARAKGARRLVQADMRTYRCAARFPLILIPYNSVQL